MKFTGAWLLYEMDKKLLGYSAHTLKGYGIQLRLLVKALGDRDIEDVTLFDLKGYLAGLTKLKPASIGHRVRFIKSLYSWAHNEGVITQNVASKLREPKTGLRLPKALGEEDIELLREGCVSAFEHAIVEFFYTSGCRIGEVVAINRNSIDWETRSVIVRGKGDKEREVYFSVKAAIWLKKYLKGRKDSDTALFVTERAPHRMSISQLRERVKQVAVRAGVGAAVYPHKLRHSYATHLLNNGAPLEVIQSLLGHAKMETTRLYAQLSGVRRRDLYQRYF